MTRPSFLLSLLLLLAASLPASRAWAQLPQPAAPPAWSAAFPDVLAQVRAGRPLVLTVVVPLCSNQQIDCGAPWAGQPGRLETNIYWGAVFGAKRIFQRSHGGWETLDTTSRESGVLEQVVLRRFVPGNLWNLDHQVEVIAVLQAVHGDQIDLAVDRFWDVATRGAIVRFKDRQTQREESVSVAGYAGHNRLMDGKLLPPAPREGRPIPSFVLACISERYFGERLRSAGSATLLTTRTLMAPEGYLVDAVVRALGENRSARAVRGAAVEASRQWQRLPRGQAEWVFAPSGG